MLDLLIHLVSKPFAEPTMPVETRTAGDTYVVRAELPGVDPDAVRADVIDGVLLIAVERRAPSPISHPGLRSEFRYGHLVRRVPLPERFRTGGVTRAYRHGILEVRINPPQVPAARARQRQGSAPGG